MNPITMAGKNLRKNASFYALYFCSAALVMTVLYAFTAFSQNQVMLEKISTNGRVESMCRVVSVFLMGFVLCYMTTANRFFLKRRARELGIYALLGFRKRRVTALLTLENCLLCLFAFAAGVLLGAVLHQVIVLGITALLGLELNSGSIPFLEPQAIGETGMFILAVVLLLTLSNALYLRKTTLMDFLRFEKKAEKTLRFRIFPALLGLVLLLLGYALALDILRGQNSLWVSVGFYAIGLLTFLLVVLGTALFIASFLPYFLKKSKARKLYTPERLITIPNFIYRIRSNTKTLILLTLLSAAVLTISSAMTLTVYYPIAAVSRMAPSELELRLEGEDQLEAIQTLVREYTPLPALYQTTDIYHVTAAADQLPEEYNLGTSKGDAENEKLVRTPGFECISETAFRALLQAQGKGSDLLNLPTLHDADCILVKYQPDQNGGDETGMVYPLNVGAKPVPVRVKAVTLDNPISFANSVGTLVVSDTFYEEIRETCIPLCTVLSLNGDGLQDNEALYTALQDVTGHSPYLQGQSHRVHELFTLNSSTFLLIGFLVVLFFLAVGSILYFNNVSAVADSRADYEILWKLGYSRAHIRRILKRQIMSFYSIPFCLGLLDCVFAVLVYRTGLMQNLLGNTPAQYIPVLLAIGVTALLYLLYYRLTVRACCKLVC